MSQLGADFGQWSRGQDHGIAGVNAYVESHEAHTIMAGYAACLIKSERAAFRLTKYLRTIPGSPEAAGFSPDLSRDDCVRPAYGRSLSIKIPDQAMRSSLYQALYQKRFGTAVAVADGLSESAPLSAAAEFDSPVSELPAQWRVRRAIGDCVVRDNPTVAHRFVVAKPWAVEETDALPSIVDILPKCLPAGQTVKLVRSDLRAMISEALYKLTVGKIATQPEVTAIGKAN